MECKRLLTPTSAKRVRERVTRGSEADPVAGAEYTGVRGADLRLAERDTGVLAAPADTITRHHQQVSEKRC